MVFAVGLTGNLASGKTTCAKIFSSFGIQVIDADEVAKELTLQNRPAYKAIIEHFGSQVRDTQAAINRKYLREIIFNNPKERLWLENLLHPLIREEIEKKVNTCSTPYCLVEIPLLFSKKDYPYLNEILVIVASENLQIERVMARDQCSKDHALSILATQPPVVERVKIADKVITNDGDWEHLRQQLEVIHQDYLYKAGSSVMPNK